MNDTDFCPYVGLQAFTESDREYFFGRERDTRLIVANVHASKLTVLYGPSGVGKSSVLMAGVMPLLRMRPHSATAIFREWQRPDALLQLKRSIAQAARMNAAPIEAHASEPLDDLLKRAADQIGGRMLLILDQFEEYFVYHPESVEGEFDAELARAVNRSDVDAGLLFSLREDALSKLDRFKPRIANLLSNSLRLEHLDTDAARDAIRRPIDRYNEVRPEAAGAPIAVDDDLITALLEQVQSGQVRLGQRVGSGEFGTRSGSEHGRVEAPFLQLVLTRLWNEERARGSLRLRLTTLQDDLGGAEQIVRAHLDSVMERLSDRDREVCSRFFDRLVTPSGSKIACRADDLTQWSGELANEVPNVVGVLSENRVLRAISPSPGLPLQYEIFHDVLAPAVLDWRTRYLQDQARRAADRELAQREAARQQELHAAQALQRAEALRAQEAEAMAIRQRRLTYVMFALFVAALFMTAYGIWQNREANRQRDVEVAGHLAAESQRLIDEDFDLGVLLAAEAVARSSTRESVRAVLGAIERLPSQIPVMRGHGERVSGVAFSPDGKLLASGSADETVILWDVARRERVGAPLEAHQGSVISVAFSGDGKLLATGGDDGTVILWDVAARKPLGAPLKAHKERVNSVAFSGDSKLLASGGDDHAVILWDVARREAVGVPLAAHKGPVMSVAFRCDGKLLASGSADMTMIVWDVARREPLGAPLETHQGSVSSVAFSPDGTLLASGGYKTLVLWDMARREPLGAPLEGHKDVIRSLAFSPDGDLLATGSADRTLILWDVARREPLSAPLAGHKNDIRSVAVSLDGKLVASGSDDRTIILWDVARREALGATLKAHKGEVSSVAYTSDGKILASGGTDGTVVLWDVARHEPLGVPLEGHRAAVSSVAFSPDGKLLASGSSDKLIVWDVAKREPRETHEMVVESVTFSPDGKLLAAGSLENVILLDVARRGPPKSLEAHKRLVNSVAFNPDGKLLASGSNDGTVIVWDVAERKPLGKPLTAHKRMVTTVAFSPDGKLMASGSDEGMVILWDVARREPLGAPLTAHQRKIASLAFSPDGKLLASGGDDRTVILWDVARAQRVGAIALEQGYIYALAFSPVRRDLAIGMKAKVPVFWDLDKPGWQSVACFAAARNLTCREWDGILAGEQYRRTCGALPGPEGCKVRRE